MLGEREVKNKSHQAINNTASVLVCSEEILAKQNSVTSTRLFTSNVWPLVQLCSLQLIPLKPLSCYMWRGNYQLWYNQCCAIYGLSSKIYWEHRERAMKAAWAIILTRKRNAVLVNSEFVGCLCQGITNFNSKVAGGGSSKKAKPKSHKGLNFFLLS